MRRVGVIALAIALGSGAAAAAYAAQSPKAVRASILEAATAQHSVHYVTREVVGNALLTLTGDVESADGIQDVGIKVGKQTAHLTIRVLDQTAYLQGDALGLQIQGLTKTQASKYAGQWISIPEGDKLYIGTAEDVTLGSALRVITPRGRLTATSRRYHGIRVVAVRGISGTGTKKELQVLAARAKGERLPLEEDEIAPGRSYIAHTVLSSWNEPVTVQAPGSSVPIATVRGS